MAPKRRLTEDTQPDVVNTALPGPGPSSQQQEEAPQSQKRHGKSNATPGRGGVKPDAAELAYMRKKIADAAAHAAAEKEKLVKSDILKNLPAGAIDSMIGRVMRHMIFSYAQKPGEIVQRQALNIAIIENYKDLKHATKLPAYIIAAAQHHLIAEMGLEMREVVHLSGVAKSNAPRATQEDEASAEAAAASAKAGGAKVYLLLSALPAALRRDYVQAPEDNHVRGLHMMVLSFVLLHGGKLEHETLVNHLRDVGLDDEHPDPHPHWGTIKEEMERMVKRRYLSYKVKPTADIDAIYEWGECAESEFGTKAVKDYIDAEFQRMDRKRNAPVAPAAPGGDEFITLE